MIGELALPFGTSFDVLFGALAISATAATIFAVWEILNAPAITLPVQPATPDHSAEENTIIAWMGASAFQSLWDDLFSSGLSHDQVDAIFSMMVGAAQALQAQRQQWVSAAVSAAQNYTLTELGITEGAILAQLGGVIANVNASVGALQSELTQTAQGIEGQIATEQAQTYAAIGSVATALDTELRGIEAGIETQLTALGNTLEISLQNTSTALQQDIAAQGQGIDAHINAQGQALQQQIEQGDSAINGYLGAAILPAITALSGTLTQAISDAATWRQQCGDPLCNNLSNFGNLIKAIEGLGLGVLGVALIAELINNPQGVQADVSGIVAPLTFGSYNAIASEVGAPAA